MDLALKGKHAIISGGSRGIGREIATLLVEEGSQVSICARNAVEVASVVSALQKRGGVAFGQAVDVRDKDELRNWVETSADLLGGIDIVFANASALDTAWDESAWQKAFELDLLHTVRAVEASLPFLERSDAGSIVVVSSAAAVESFDKTLGPAYGSMKSALIHYASRMAHELASRHVKVNVISPGYTFSDGGIWHGVQQEDRPTFESIQAQIPWGRMASAREVAAAAVFLASPISGFTTGTNLIIDGGLTRRVQY